MTTRPMAERVHFRVRGLPIPQGSKRIGRHGAKPVILDSNDQALKVWRDSVGHAGRAALKGRQPMDCPIVATVDFFLPRPKSHLTTSGALRASAPLRPAVKPDADKLIRALGDALAPREAALRVIVDDSRIVEWHVGKHYGAPGVIVELERAS